MNLFHFIRAIFAPYRLEFGGGGQNTTVQKADPWAGQQPYLLELMKKAQANYASSSPTLYSSPMTAAVSPDTTAAQNTLRSFATGGAQQTAENAQGALNFNLTDARDVNSNPYLQSAINAAIRPVERRLTEAGGELYNIGDQSMAAGQFGGTRQGVAEGIALGRFGETAGDIAARMSSEGYQSGLDASTKALALTPQTLQAGTLPAQYQDVVGQQQRQYEQELINEAVNRWNFDQNKETQKLATYQNLITGGFGGESTSTASGGRGNPILGAAGGALTGFSMGTMLGGAENGAAWGPWGAAIGAIIGLMGS